jgi:hypothetical protein
MIEDTMKTQRPLYPLRRIDTTNGNVQSVDVSQR